MLRVKYMIGANLSHIPLGISQYPFLFQLTVIVIMGTCSGCTICGSVMMVVMMMMVVVMMVMVVMMVLSLLCLLVLLGRC